MSINVELHFVRACQLIFCMPNATFTYVIWLRQFLKYCISDTKAHPRLNPELFRFEGFYSA